MDTHANPRPDVRFTPVRACGRLIVCAGLQTSLPTHPSASAYHTVAGSAVIDFSITMVIINAAADHFRPNISGDIHLRSILLASIIFVKEQLLWHVIFLTQDNCSLQMRCYITGTEHVPATFCTGVSSVSCHLMNEREHIAVPVAQFTSTCRDHARD